MYFTIDAENAITALDAAPAAQEGTLTFTSQKDLAKITAEWPMSRLAETWNGFAGVAPFGDLKPLKKFTDRNTAIARIWNVIQKLAPAAPTQPAAVPSKTPRKASKRAAANDARPAREGTAKAKVIQLMSRKGGASMDEIVEATGWQRHTVRGFVSTMNSKGGLSITSSRRESDKARVYEVTR
jgi:hypothetical protein